MKSELNEEARKWMLAWFSMHAVWGESIYQHCIDDGYVPDKNTTTREKRKRLLIDSETQAMAMIVCFYYDQTGTLLSRRQLSKTLDKQNPKAKDTKIVRDLEKLESFGLLIHNPPSQERGDRYARYIEPTPRLISFFNKYCKDG